MKTIHIPFVPAETLKNSIEEINRIDELLAWQDLDEVPWQQFPYCPKVRFGLAHCGNAIFIKFSVEEKQLRAENKEINGSVWEDSCVEFFVRFDDAGYYNFEFNCIGTPLVGFGKQKTGRSLLPESVIKRMQINVQDLPPVGKDSAWQLVALIPSNIFIHHSFETLEGLDATANFYKCGDLTPTPHFISWNLIEAENPNFHLPEFFGGLHFNSSHSTP